MDGTACDCEKEYRELPRDEMDQSSGNALGVPSLVRRTKQHKSKKKPRPKSKPPPSPNLSPSQTTDSVTPAGTSAKASAYTTSMYLFDDSESILPERIQRTEAWGNGPVISDAHIQSLTIDTRYW